MAGILESLKVSEGERKRKGSTILYNDLRRADDEEANVFSLQTRAPVHQRQWNGIHTSPKP